MNNVNSSNGAPSGKNNTPLLIIGAVLLVAILGGWWLYSTNNSPKPPKTGNTNTAKGNTNTKAVDEAAAIKAAIDNAPAGANPPNMLGSPAATVTVEEFADYQCPTCATVHPMIQEIAKTYGNKIKFVYRSFPLTTIHAHSYDAAVAAEAAGLQGKFWEMQNQLFSNQKDWANAADAVKIFEGYAEKIGLDVDKYKNDVLGLAAKARVDADMARGRKIGITGTPTIYINNQPLAFENFNVEAMRQVIDGELKKGSAAPNAQTANPAANANANSAATANNSAK